MIGLFGYDRPEVSGIMEGYPAEEAGLMPGDVITELNGHNILIYRDITAYIMTHEGKELRLTYERDGEKADTVIVPKYSADAGRYLIGITGGAYPRCPVKTDRAVPKGKLLDIMKELNQVELTSPVAIGQVALQNAAGTGASVVVTKDL